MYIYISSFINGNTETRRRPFFDLTDDGASPSRIKEEDGGAGPSSGAAGMKKENEEDEEDPYYAFRRRYRRQ